MTNLSAKALLEEFWDMKVPVDPEFFAKKLGLTVVFSKLGAKSGYLDVSRKEIHVNESENKERQRFTIAHELGHFCLGHGSSYRDTRVPSSFLYNESDAKKEYLANQFAADLLMPAIAIKALIDGMGIRDASKLRKHLGVSSQALYVRLLALGYIND